MAALELPSRGGRARSHGTRGSAGGHLGREARSGVEEHVAAPELPSRRGRAQSHVTRGSAGGQLGREARSGAKERMAAPELNSARRRGHGSCGSTGAYLSKEVRFETMGHMMASEPTSTGRCDPKLQFIWQCVHTQLLILTYGLYTG
jgi:hypothetical protein